VPSLLIHELAYQQDSLLLFRKVAEQPWSMFLDSCNVQGTTGRYDILVADPVLMLVTEGGFTTLTSAQGVEQHSGNPLSILQSVLSLYEAVSDATLPFCGGAVGYLSYDLAASLYESFSVEPDDLELPEMAMAIYGWAVIVDHHIKRTVLVGQGGLPPVKEKWEHLVELFSGDVASDLDGENFQAVTAIRSNMDAGQYRSALARIEHYLTEGDCYQVNYAQRFECRVSGRTVDGYEKLRSVNPAPFSAFLNLPFTTVLCSSPELFLQCQDGQVVTSPIKGTRSRAADPGRDQELANELQHSDKDRAENLMIVDLLRNDLGKVCKPGSIKVPELFQVESFASVHHLVSTVTGELASGNGPIELLQACFPGGSITGAPKIRAMEIIRELEPNRRNIYCGAIGYIGFDGKMKTNVAIRTVVLQEEYAYYWAGGGIVIDSQWLNEYQESYDKASALFEMMGQGNENYKM
jgi:para-aminobenzoate synthetase component 1